ncbi:putative c2h2 finger domain-containing protein [Erysiphe neolycopersici]|uniref:Putative c2h2 finger domain-containing protein n=1 Tax=Erysiphe neolycopersici TaxID=212602 RepID=A0A420I879_9PEZI|nr:putative c2h2 finger domain-containing protein [Erysiphe neolycopersici]
MHPLSQKLKCHGCDKSFPRLGALVAHIESSQCKLMTENHLSMIRQKKLRDYETQKAARNFKDFNRCGFPTGFDTEPLPFSLSTNKRIEGQESSTSIGRLKNDGNEDLISFENQPATWDNISEPTSEQSHWTSTESSLNHNQSNASNGNIASKQPKNITDPNMPGFRAETFYIPLLMKYKCPHRSCGKTIKSKTGFIQHLNSQAHRNEELKCVNCLKHFATATALTQHCDSQSLRCRIRESDSYDQMVDIMTSGFATVIGRLPDNTVKYSTNVNVRTK